MKVVKIKSWLNRLIVEVEIPIKRVIVVEQTVNVFDDWKSPIEILEFDEYLRNEYKQWQYFTQNKLKRYFFVCVLPKCFSSLIRYLFIQTGIFTNKNQIIFLTFLELSMLQL